jgi:hypothetical protein
MDYDYDLVRVSDQGNQVSKPRNYRQPWSGAGCCVLVMEH